MSHVDQLEDSINLMGMPVVTELFFPVGLRYHALHHLFPTLPYHHLAEAHRRLLAALPEGSSYHRTVAPGFWVVAKDVFRTAWLRDQNGDEAKRTGRADEWYGRRAALHAPRDRSIASVTLNRPPQDRAPAPSRVAATEVYES
jgi:fatty acid desaturase